MKPGRRRLPIEGFDDVEELALEGGEDLPEIGAGSLCRPANLWSSRFLARRVQDTWLVEPLPAAGRHIAPNRSLSARAARTNVPATAQPL